MKNKLFILLMLFSNCTIAQNIAISLSIVWKKEFSIFNDGATTQYPYLLISYTNLSDSTDYYFKRIADKSGTYPNITGSFTMYYYTEEKPDMVTIAKSETNQYANKKIIVRIGGWRPSIHNSWDVFMEDTYENAVIKGLPYTRDVIRDCLNDMYNYMVCRDLNTLNHDRTLQETAVRSFHAKQWLTDINTNAITENPEPFVFIKARETITDTFNLAPFYELGGVYRFELAYDTLPGYLERYSPTFGNEEVPLPDSVGQYKLYQGKVLSNEVVLKTK